MENTENNDKHNARWIIYNDKHYKIDKLTSYDALTAMWYGKYNKDTYEPGLYVYFKKYFYFSGDLLMIKSNDIFVPRVINSGKKKRFLYFFKINERIVNPMWILITQGSEALTNAFKSETGIAHYNRIKYLEWIAYKIHGEKEFFKVKKDCEDIFKILSDQEVISENVDEEIIQGPEN